MNIKLLPLEIEDLGLVYELYNDSQVFDTAILGYNYPQNKPSLKSKLESWIKNGKQKHFKVVNDKQEEIGLAQIFDIHTVNRSCKIGIIVKPDFWGKGYATQILHALEEICYDHIGLRRIEAEVLANNLAIMKLLENQNYNREGTRKEAIFKKSEHIDAHVYGKVV
ncbi:GNAT family N-acetyltransferase [Bacillus sp. FJAT-45037]|uniref:GNAT family N-acetyltransferase n=1 Tax=Bacillus sp. FJAT-45037 TaxID=2011007 RepID=UPI000C235B96|nr:GNAT family N-acetyltransferase [Bacillus sp. FJAT-45037]